MSKSGLTAERPDGERGAVFISYSRGDREFVQRLRDGLTARGHPCWVDWQGIRPTASWMDEVRAAIDAAPAFVFVASPASVDSEVCLEEIDHADKVRKRFLPIVRGEVDADGLPDPISSRHWISMRPEDDFDQALGELVVALDTEPKWAAAHTRLLLRAAEWDRNGRDSSFALRGRDLATAERWLTEADERKDPQPARLHTEYIIASRRAATRSQRIRMAALGAGLLVTAALAAYATIQRSHADERAREARSRELAAQALLNRASDPEVGLLYAVEAARIDQTPEAELAMRQLLPKSHATAVFSAGGAAIKNAVLSPNGRLAATVSENGVARIWDVRNGRVTQRLDLGPGLATDVAFNRRGSELLTAAVRGSVTLWNVRSGTRVRVFQGLTGVIESAEFSPDGELVVAGGTDGGRVWKVEEPRQPLSTLSGDQGTVWGVSFSPDGRRVVSAGADGTVRVWNARTGGQERRFSLQSQPRTSSGDDANSAVFSPDGRRILVSGDDGAARIWGLASGHVTLVIPASANKTYAASFSPDGRRIVTGSLDGEARVWDPTRPLPGVAGSPPRARLLAVLHAPTGQVLSASFGLDDHTVIAGESGGVARIWDTAGLDHVDSFPDLGDEVLGADFSPDGRQVVTSNANSKTRVWDPRSGRTLRLLAGHKAVRSAEFNPDGSQIVTAGNDGAVRVWKAGRTRPIVLPGPGILLAATFSPNGRSVASAGADGMVRIWNVHDRTHTEFRADQGFVSDVAFSNDGRELATAGQSGASLWDESTGTPLRALRGRAGEMTSVAFSPNGKTVAVADADSTVRIWDVESGGQLTPLRGASDALFTLAFNPSGSEIAAGGVDGMVRVWDTHSEQLLDTIHGPEDTVTAVAFSPSGKSILATSFDGKSYLMQCGVCIPVDRLERIAAERVGAALTPGERAQYLGEVGEGG